MEEGQPGAQAYLFLRLCRRGKEREGPAATRERNLMWLSMSGSTPRQELALQQKNQRLGSTQELWEWDLMGAGSPQTPPKPTPLQRPAAFSFPIKDEKRLLDLLLLSPSRLLFHPPNPFALSPAERAQDPSPLGWTERAWRKLSFSSQLFIIHSFCCLTCL